MTFTDDYLKLLKEWADLGSKAQLDPEDIYALLARLEAAEKVIKEVEYMAGAGFNTTTRSLMWDAVKAWRKAAGK